MGKWKGLLRIGLLLISMLLGPVGALDSVWVASAALINREKASNATVVLPVMRPEGAAAATLHTHVATMQFEYDEQNRPWLRFEARYDLRNETRNTLGFSIRLEPGALSDLTVTKDGAAVDLVSAEDGLPAAQVTIPPNQSSALTLTTRQALDGLSLVHIEYPTELLRRWRGQRSIRIELIPGNALERDAWLRIEPDSWSYSPFADDGRFEWLFEGEIPARILFQSIAPDAWRTLQQLLGNAVGGAPSAYAALAEHYRKLATAALLLGQSTLYERFAAQATAAYLEGIRRTEAGGAPAIQSATLHAGLAGLYRERLAYGEDLIYAQLMVDEVELALRGLMVDDPRRAELEQWRADGLRLLLTDLRRRGDIPAALALIEQLRSLAANDAGSDFLEQERQALLVQQAVELIERGDRAGALALAGDLINAPTLQPPSEYRNLFTRWNVSTVISERGVEVRAEVRTDKGREQEAQKALEEIVHTWRSSPELRAMMPAIQTLAEAEGERGFELTFKIPLKENGAGLARALPSTPDWTLLRNFLNQLGPQIRTDTNGVWQRMEVTQPLDLRSVGEEWRRIADELEGRAEAFEQDSLQTATTMQAALEARLRAANYRDAAQGWRELAQNSGVIISLTPSEAAGHAPRTWMVAVDSPPEMLTVQVETISGVRVLLSLLIVFGGLFAASALLWRLLV
ncbi:MAG: hypothetical protein NZ553_19385 [Caldilinea sp.]|nr:hypothetical protein [Caldilinea sp.]MDW8442646.1 hypothetical protein [Caldilineaceae bacterium]